MIASLALCLTVSDAHAAHVDDVVSLLRPHVATLDRPLLGFHYQSEFEFDPRSPRDVTRRLEGIPEGYFDASRRDETSLGPGLYLAGDPVNSRSYGDETPHLFVLTLQAATRVLNVANPLTADQLGLAQKIAANLGCGSPPVNLESFMKSMRSSANAICREVVIEAVRRLEIGAMFYDYFKPFPLMGCRGTRDAAILVVDSRIFVPDTLDYYSHVRRLGVNVHQSEVRTLYRETTNDPYRTFSFHDEMPRALDGSSTSANYEAWKARFILGCGPGRTAEGVYLRTDRFLEALRAQHRDVEIKRLYDRAKNAFFARIIPWLQSTGRFADYSMSKLVWLQRLEFRALPKRQRRMTFSEFQKAKTLAAQLSVSHRNSESRIAKLSKVIGEDVTAMVMPSPEILQAEANKLTRSHLTVFEVAKLLGLNARGAFLLTNVLVNDQHGVPLLVRADRGKSMSEAISASRALLKNVLETCIAQYEDSSLPPAEVFSGLCGVELPTWN